MKIKIVSNGRQKVFKQRTERQGPGDFFFLPHLSFADKMNNPVARDLLRIAQGVFLADRFVPRGRRFGMQTREILVIFELEKPAVFASIQQQL